MTMYTIILSQNKFVHKDALFFPIEERGLQFGDGVYEVIRIYEGRPYLLKEHIARLFRSLQAIHIELTMNANQLIVHLHQLIEINDMYEDGFIYLQVTRGSAERNHPFPAEVEPNLYAYIKHRERPLEQILNGVKVITLPDERWENCYIKSLNLLPNVLARQKATEQQAFEAILHRDSTITEGSASNVFLVKDGTIFTHPESKHILSGCVRSAIIRFAEENNIPIHEKAFTLNDIQTADEMFLTSSISEIIPIIQVNERKIADGKRGPIAEKLQHAYEVDAQIDHRVASAK